MGVFRESIGRRVIGVMAVLILAAIAVAAQLPTGAILGTVKDSSGASVSSPLIGTRFFG